MAEYGADGRYGTLYESKLECFREYLSVPERSKSRSLDRFRETRAARTSRVARELKTSETEPKRNTRWGNAK